MRTAGGTFRGGVRVGSPLPRARSVHETPAMRQYATFKARHPDCVLFFRMGDFYELFHEDAKLAHEVLGLTLTQRTEGIPMAGVPYHALDGYLRRMICQGYRVAVCEQIQDPKEAKGVVDRAVTRVLTPGTLVDEALLEEDSPNQVGAIQFTEDGEESAAVLALAEVSTGRFTLTDLPSDRIADELARLRPSELLYAETADGSLPGRVARAVKAAGCALTSRPGWTFRHRDAGELLRGHFGVTTLAGFGLDDDDPAIGAAGALLRYLQETQSPDGSGQTSRLGHLRPPKRTASDGHVIIDATTLASLEVERTIRRGETEGSLLSILQRCRTAMGKRLLRQWLCFPLREVEAIEGRQRAVAALVEDRGFAEALSKAVGHVQDVARISSRVSMLRASPRDIVALGRSVSLAADLGEILEDRPAFAGQRERLLEMRARLEVLSEGILSRCVDSPPAHLREGGLFRDGADGELDEARLLRRDAKTWLAAYQKRLIEEAQIRSLKVGYNKVFGYYIEVTHAHTEKIPANFTRKQTLKNAERYITPELKEFEEKVTTAEARAIERERVLFERLCRQAASHVGVLIEYADLVAELDVLHCFAEVAAGYGYVRPRMVESPVIEIRQGRHPVLDRMLGRGFVPNDCVLGREEGTEGGSDEATERRSDGGGGHARRGGTKARRDEGTEGEETEGGSDEGTERRRDGGGEVRGDGEDRGPEGKTLALITGPNMAGKSTYIRQVAIIVLLAHTGCFVPAESATIGLTDRIFTRIGASDELHAGQSTFMVEMTETANILHHATERSLVILDEIGRGTSTLDGLALAWAVTETIAGAGCRTLFATHYHELTGLGDRLENVKNLHVSVREWGEEIVFLYRILPGRTDRSYGIHVAKIAGIPGEAIRRATEVLETLAVQTESPQLPGPERHGPRAGEQLGLFTEYLDHPAVEELRGLDLTGLSPLEAFDALRRLQEQVQEGKR